MAFGSFDPDAGSRPMAEINTTPLVDVMLVLLVIFIITAPLFTHAIRLDLPQAESPAAPERPGTISLSIDASGTIFWNSEPLAGLPDLERRLATAATSTPRPELQLRADRETRYQTIAEVMAAAQSAGLDRLGFVTDPKPAAATGSTAPR
jgi:biopolymer transport protein ExbD